MNLKRAVALFCCAVLVLSCFGCSGGAIKVNKIDVSTEHVYPQVSDFSAHYCKIDNLMQIDTSGLITLLYDENTSAVVVSVDNSEESKLWTALPQLTDEGVLSAEADIISLDIVHDGQIYHLNSQDNSVVFGSVYYTETDEGFDVTYIITDNSAWLENIDLDASDDDYKDAAEGNIAYKVVVTYSLKDGCFYASFNWTNLGQNDDVLVNIGFLEYFGAQSTATEGDYILVPDGSGALIYTATDEEVAPVNIAVYGNDVAGFSSMTGIVPAYGMRCGNDAFAAIIETGESIAKITANKANNSSDYNRVGTAFAVSLSENDEKNFYYSDVCYDDEISICFRFLSGANATYAGMAAACREQLIRNYTLSTRSVEVTEHMPMLVNVIGQVSKNGFAPFSTKLTDFTQATDVLNRIKSKGINNVYLRYSGALSGGLRAENAVDATPLSSLGGMSGVENLDSYASGLNFSVFYDIDLLSDNSSSSSLKNLHGNKYSVVRKDFLSGGGFGVREDKRYFGSSSSLENTVLSVLERFYGLDATGYCLTDVGSYLCTDLDLSVNREVTAEMVSNQISPLSTSSPVMICGGNFYALKHADVVSELPMTCSRVQSASYVAVPFVQIILHGIVEFTYDGINTFADSKTAVLKCVEYGAIPGYVLTNNLLDDSSEYATVFSVDSWLSSMYDTYASVGEVLNDLRGSRITNHYLISEGVYCTEYESTTKIYVNYSEKSIVVSGITVAPMSFFRVN